MDQKIINFIIENEGTGKQKQGRFFPYSCPAQKMTMGYGRNIEDNGISEDEALFMLQNDIIDSVKHLKKIFIDFDNFSDARRTALVDMMFNLGYIRFIDFKKMINYVHRQDWENASKEAIDSKWYKQVGNRGIKVARMIRTGTN